MFRILFLLCILATGSSLSTKIHTFAEPIDAISFGVDTENIGLSVRGWTENGWTDVFHLEVENESDPILRETNLIVFQSPVTRVQVLGHDRAEPHPIVVDRSPISYETAARGSVGRPRILTRKQWGANESYLLSGGPIQRSDLPRRTNRSRRSRTQSRGDNGSSGRVEDCEIAQRDHSQDFRVARTEPTDQRGRALRWARRYSPNIKLLVLHHTHQKVTGDSRSGLEKMRALYAYHSNNRKWGDIGYHYVIDEDGRIYEGRSGGDYVVGGHTYCGNVGTIGVALIGSFSEENPTSPQLKSAQWLLDHLSKRYRVDLRRTARFHGKSLPAIVGHRDLVATECPGENMYKSMHILRKNIASGNLDDVSRFPKKVHITHSHSRGRHTLRTSLSSLRSYVRGQLRPPSRPTVTRPTYSSPFTRKSSEKVVGRPGGTVQLQLFYRSPKAQNAGTRIGRVRRSTSQLGVWQVLHGKRQRVRDQLLLPEDTRIGQQIVITLEVQLPSQTNTYSLDIDNVSFELRAEGRRTRTGKQEPTRQSFSTRSRRNVPTAGQRARLRGRSIPSTIGRSRTQTRDQGLGARDGNSPNIRIKLSFTGNTGTISGVQSINNQSSDRSTVILQKNGSQCSATSQVPSANGHPRLEGDILTVTNWSTPFNQFRGVLECRIVDGRLTLINELSMEDYLAGLAEEPDTEPYEKQKAFAVAARSYAEFYRSGAGTKFPGKPYDGSDSPAEFQKYGGVVFEKKHPRWVQAVRETSGEVLSYNGEVVKAAYFSSSDGRTRSPEENGWRGFPHAAVFSSKPDPWCRGLSLRGHGVGMSGCGAEGQANEGKSAEEILKYYYKGVRLDKKW